tara:strand:- start:165 stop:689 length:525 start_codon:yes stop_codon:yes gene_type:complete
MYRQFQSSEPKNMSNIKPYHNPETLRMHRKRYHTHQPFSKEHVLKMQRRLLDLKRERDLVYRRIREKQMQIREKQMQLKKLQHDSDKLQHDSDNINYDMDSLNHRLDSDRRSRSSSNSSVSSNSSMGSMKTHRGFESDPDFEYDSESDRGFSDSSDFECDDARNSLDTRILNRH